MIINLAWLELRCVPEPNSGCWLWMRSGNPKGYGQARISGRNGGLTFAHRIAWMIAYGDPGSLSVLHKCDTPCCVNPEHLFIGTKHDNMQDMARKKRQVFQQHPERHPHWKGRTQ